MIHISYSLSYTFSYKGRSLKILTNHWGRNSPFEIWEFLRISRIYNCFPTHVAHNHSAFWHMHYHFALHSDGTEITTNIRWDTVFSSQTNGATVATHELLCVRVGSVGWWVDSCMRQIILLTFGLLILKSSRNKSEMDNYAFWYRSSSTCKVVSFLVG